MALTATATAQTQIVAHRGYWKTEGSAQNSITALNRAAEIGVYGSEFDVQLTSDSVIMVNHDDSYQGHVIAQTPFEVMKTMKLANGEYMPTLQLYLEAGKQHPNLKMVLEIKPHKTQAEEDYLARRCVEMVKSMGMEDQVEYISFSLHVCEQLARLDPKAMVEYLAGDIAPKDLLAKGIRGIDYHYSILLDKPQWIAEAHNLGMVVNAWTVDDLAIVKRLKDLKVDFITTNVPEEAK